jgi:hypothetical protein
VEKKGDYIYDSNPFKIPMRQLRETMPEGTQSTCKPSGDNRVGDCVQVDKERLVEGLAEAEPPWTPMDQIDRKWANIETELVLIRMLYKDRAVEEFRERLGKIMEGM